MSNYRRTVFTVVVLLVIASFVFYTHYFDYYSDIANKIRLQFIKTSNFDFNVLFKSNDKNQSDVTLANQTIESYQINGSNKCSIFNKNAKQFSITIDGVTYPKYVPLYHNNSYNFSCMNQDSSSKLILFWTNWFGDPTFEFGLGKAEPFAKHHCPVTNCEVTNDKNRLSESDLIIFHMRDSIDYLPTTRKPNQRWVFLLFESPVHSSDFSQYNGLFNMTSTYKASSDFTSIYYAESHIRWGDNKNYDINKDFYSDKTEFAAIVVSNCGASNKRLDFVKELQQHISVQVYGKCGKPCPSTFDNGTKADCKRILGHKYKFYLAFENSICNEYVTEKFFYILEHDVIPVVFGAGPYDYHVPKSGYINALDYDSPKSLADYLLFLDSNKTAYNSYFKWKKYIYVDHRGQPTRGHLCEMCIRLNLDPYLGIKNNIIKDFASFWSTKADCRKVQSEDLKKFNYVPYRKK